MLSINGINIAWRELVKSTDEEDSKPIPELGSIIEQMVTYVYGYLKIREDMARAEHKQRIAERGQDRGIRKPRRPHLRIKKQKEVKTTITA